MQLSTSLYKSGALILHPPEQNVKQVAFQNIVFSQNLDLESSV